MSIRAEALSGFPGPRLAKSSQLEVRFNTKRSCSHSNKARCSDDPDAPMMMKASDGSERLIVCQQKSKQMYQIKALFTLCSYNTDASKHFGAFQNGTVGIVKMYYTFSQPEI